MTNWSLGRDPDEPVTCARCLESRDPSDVDRLRWCGACREKARGRAWARGWQVGTVAALLLGLWIWIFIRPSTLIWGGWLATLVACLYLVARLARELHFGIARIRNARAVEARPPGGPSWEESSPDPSSPDPSWEEGR